MATGAGRVTVMKLDIVDSSEGRLLRLFQFSPGEAQEIHALIADLAGGTSESLQFDELSFVEPRNGIRLALSAGQSDIGLSAGSERQYFWRLTPFSWETVSMLIEPFLGTDGADGFQYLTDQADLNVLLSPSGSW